MSFISSCYQSKSLPPVKSPPTTESLRLGKINTLYNSYRKEFPNAPEINVAQILRDTQRKKLVFIDVREDYEIKVSLIENAITLEEFEDNIEEYSDALLVIYCTIGYRSGLYTEELKEEGYDAVNLIGGVLLWAHHGLEFQTPKGKSTSNVHVYGKEWDLLPVGFNGIY